MNDTGMNYIGVERTPSGVRIRVSRDGNVTTSGVFKSTAGAMRWIKKRFTTRDLAGNLSWPQLDAFLIESMLEDD